MLKNELYASLELQITMAQDYSEWLKQETKRNTELLESHSSALSRLNELMVQSPSEDEKVDSSPAQELPDGLKWEDAPEWADSLAEYLADNDRELVWCNPFKYRYVNFYDDFQFEDGNLIKNLRELKIIATRPEGA